MYYRSIDGSQSYDWVHEHCTRSPREYMYSYSEHYVWRDFDKFNMPEDVTSAYSDRMMQWDYEKYKKCVKGVGWIENVDKKTAKRIIKEYYDGKYECVGFAKSCNWSTGYGLSLIHI